MDKPPCNPYGILALSMVLPGSGHVLQGVPTRGLMFLFFMIVLGWASTHVMPEHFSFVGRHIGGVLVYGLSILDAYKIARVNHATWTHSKKARME